MAAEPNGYKMGRFKSLCLAFFAVFLWVVPAMATDNCMQDIWNQHGNKQKLTCTANDVRIAFADNIRSAQAPFDALTQCVSGQTFSFIADFHVELTAQIRYDIGLYFATDGDPNGDGALTGMCDGNIIEEENPNPPNLGSANFIQLDPPADACGDIDDEHNPQVVTVLVTNVLCTDSDNDGLLNLPNCTSWRIAGSNELCQVPFDAYPGSPSKCNCEPEFNIPVFVEPGSIKVTKEVVDPVNATLPEPGGQFTYGVTVLNTALFTSVTIDKICDDKFGEIDNDSLVACPAGSIGTIDETDCTVPQMIGPGANYQCSFKATVTGEPQDVTDTVTASGTDEHGQVVEDSDSAQVHITDEPPMADVVKAYNSLLCSTVRYDVSVNNLSSSEMLELTNLNDDVYGDITQVQGNVVATTCSVPQNIAASSSYQCTFDGQFCGASNTDIITGMLGDNDGNTITPQSNSVTVQVSGQQVP